MVRHVIDLCSKIWWQFILSLEKTDRFEYQGELNKKTDRLFEESSVKQLLSNPSFMLSWSDLLILVTPRSVVGKSSAHTAMITWRFSFVRTHFSQWNYSLSTNVSCVNFNPHYEGTIMYGWNGTRAPFSWQTIIHLGRTKAREAFSFRAWERENDNKTIQYCLKPKAKLKPPYKGAVSPSMDRKVSKQTSVFSYYFISYYMYYLGGYNCAVWRNLYASTQCSSCWSDQRN